jgi:hypothetical protein
MTQFNNNLETLLTAINRRKLNAYLFLDSNINLLKLNTDHTASNYHYLIINNGYLQTITRATRIQGGHFSLIATTRIFSNTNIENFKLTLRNLTWRTTTDSADVNNSYSHFWTDFQQDYDVHFPKIAFKANKSKRRINNFLTPCSTTGKPTRSFATERVSLDSV